jgi:ribosome-binding protein aMBF1 (putative translation factor)
VISSAVGRATKDTIVKLSEMKPQDRVVAAALRDDPAVRSEWERMALARAVAVAVTRVRAARGLSQREIAALLAMTQPQVARLERGDVNPSMDTLMRVAAGLDIEFMISVRPATRKARLTTRKAQEAHAVGGVRTKRADVRIAAA